MLYDIRSRKETSEGDNIPMKKVIIFVLIIFFVLSFTSVLAIDTRNIEETNTTSTLIESRQAEKTALEKSIEKYRGNVTYGTTAYVLDRIAAYSIPVCFLGIAVGAISQFILGTRKLDYRHRGSRMMLSFLTIFVICQVLPLIFAVVVMGWR